MAYLPIEEFKTHAYNSEIEAIINGDETIALAAIDVAIEYAKSKLAKGYDVDAIFATEGANRNSLLLKVVKDVAIWELIGLANPSINYEDKKFRYEQSVDWLTAVYKGMPANLPKKPVLDDNDSSTGTSFSFHSNPKRTTHY